MIRNTGIPDNKKIYQIDFYERCCEKVIDVFRHFEEIISLYRFGNVNAPGNSDIDLIFVTENKKNIGKFIRDCLEKKFSPSEQYLVYQHYPMILTEQLMTNIHYIRFASNLRKLYGKTIGIEDQVSEEIKFMQLVELIIQYYRQIDFDNAPEWYRWPLQIINAFKFIKTSAYNFGYKEEDDCINEVLITNDKLRSNIQNINEIKIKKFSSFAFPVLKNSVREIELWLSNKIQDDYEFWPKKINNIKINNIVLKNKENKFMDILSNNQQLFFHSGIFLPLFFQVKILPPPLRKDAIKRQNIMRDYCKFLYKNCNAVGLYYPWNHNSFNVIKKIRSQILNYMINYSKSYIFAKLFFSLNKR